MSETETPATPTASDPMVLRQHLWRAIGSGKIRVFEPGTELPVVSGRLIWLGGARPYGIFQLSQMVDGPLPLAQFSIDDILTLGYTDVAVISGVDKYIDIFLNPDLPETAPAMP